MEVSNIQPPKLVCLTKLDLAIPPGLPPAPQLIQDVKSRRRKFEWKGVPVEEWSLPWSGGKRMTMWVMHSMERGYFEGKDQAGNTQNVLNPMFTCEHDPQDEIAAVEVIRVEFERHWKAATK